MGAGQWEKVYVVHGRLWMYFSFADSDDGPCQVGPLPLSVNPPARGTLMRIGSSQN